MPDIADSLVVNGSASRTKPRVRTALWAVFSSALSFVAVMLLVLSARSYTWRDRMTVPLSNTRFCRIDSNDGQIEFETYGRSMGEEYFSITALSHADISNAWRSFTSGPQPDHNDRWLWERSTTGRLFIHVPHWFPFVLLVALAVSPWLRWHFTTRTLIIATTLIAVVLGIIVWMTRAG
jgi:hypothetical protein